MKKNQYTGIDRYDMEDLLMRSQLEIHVVFKVMHVVVMRRKYGVYNSMDNLHNYSDKI